MQIKITFSKLEEKKTTEIVDKIVNISKVYGPSAVGLCLDNNALHNRTTEELIQIFQAIPPYIISLDLGCNNLGRKNTAELVAIFKAIPPTIKQLDLSDNELDSKTAAELTQIFANLSIPLVRLKDIFWKSNEEISLILAALPVDQRTLDLTDTIGWSSEQPRILHILNAIPKQITTLLLSSNKFDKKTLPQLVQIFAAIPAHVTTLSLADNNLGSKTCAELIQILCMIPKHISDLSLYNNNLDLETHSYEELLQIFGAFPEEIKKLDLNGNFASLTPTQLLKLIRTIPIPISKNDWYYYCNYINAGAITAALLAISAETTELCLKKILYWTKTVEIINIFKEIPPQITTLDLSENDFYDRTASDIIAIFEAIPAQITNLNLHNMHLFSKNKTKKEVVQIIAAIPPQVTTLDLSDNALPKSVNEIQLLLTFPVLITNWKMRNSLYGKTATDLIEMLEAKALEVTNFTLLQQILHKKKFHDFYTKGGCGDIHDYKVLEAIDAKVQLEEIVFSSTSYAEFIDKLELFLVDRWDRIKETELAYPKTALNDKMTVLCLKIAGLIARHKKQEKNIYQYLMPTIKECYDPVTDLSLSSLTLNQFVLDEQHEYGFNLETLYMHHSYAQGDSQAMAATLINPYIPHAEGESGIAISDQTFLNMIYHSKESLAYHRAYEAWFNPKNEDEKLLGPALQTLMKGLKRGSVQGTGSEFIPGIEALDAIAEFYTFFRTLSAQTQRTLLPLETGQKNFNHSTDRYEPEIFEHIWMILIQEDRKGLGCVNILSDKIALILAQPKYQESLFGLKRKTLHNLFEKSAQIFQESYRISKFDMNCRERPIPIALFFNLIIKNHKNIRPDSVITMLRNLNIPAGSVYPTNTLVQHLITQIKGNSKVDLVKETQVFCNQTSGISTIGFFGFKTDISEDNTALLENQNKR